MFRVGFESMTAVFEREETFLILYLMATVNGAEVWMSWIQ
jgi:hypothetical protein